MNLDRINERYHGDLADPATERARERIHWMCTQAAGRDILDIGCSQGIVCLILGREGFRCIGIDLEQASLNVARKALAEEDKIVQDRVAFQLADASQLPFEDGSFDTVMLGEVLEHLVHPVKVLDEAKRVLREGGRLVVTVPHGLSAYHDHKRTFYPVSLLNFLRPFFQAQTLEILNNYITYTGVKDRAYQPVGVSGEARLEECLRWELALETHCLQKERALFEMGTKLYAQVKSLTTQSKAQADRIRELDEAVAAKNNSVQELERSVQKAAASVESLREGVKQAEALQARLSGEAVSSRAALAAVEQRFAGLQSEAAELRRELISKDAAVARLNVELENSKAARSVADADRAALEAQIAALRKELGERNVAWEQRISQIETMHAARRRELERQVRDLVDKQQSELNRRLANQRIREVVRSTLPVQSRVLVISKGDDDLLLLDGRHGSHFPQAAGGVYAGYHPADSAEAIAHLEELRAKGAEFLLIPASSFWWMEYYADFRRHLELQYHLLTYSEDTCVIFALSAPAGKGRGRLAVSLDRPSDRTQAVPAQVKPVAALRVPASVKGASTVVPAKPLPALSGPRSTAAVVIAKEARPAPDCGRLAVGGIFDEFTAACFRPDCTLVTFRPDNWKTVLERTPIDLLFVESAWHGNGGSWQYKIASFKKPMGDEIVDVVTYCKERGIPTVFWNKEDPPHFDRFIPRAPLFDVVFTSDAEMIPRYREVVQHDRVFALPFAAQPRIHNPILDTARSHNVCFAGAYYAADHDERRADMDHLLRPALEFGLHIYDRQHGLAGANAKLYQFPDIFQPAIKGRLEYDDMVKAYKWYKVFLNVNSVKTSPTMFSRRVFELLASGTPVISAPAKAIPLVLGEAIVLMTESEAETRAHLKRLLGDDDFWARLALRGIRTVLSHHTYAHRLAEVCRCAGARFASVALPPVAAIAKAQCADDLRRLADTLARQTYRNFSLVLQAGKGLTSAKLDLLRKALPDITVRILSRSGSLIRELVEAPPDGHVWLVRPDDYYGDEFLHDAVLTTRYSDADVIGKCTCFELEPGGSSLRIREAGHDFRFERSLVPGSILAKAGKLDAGQWQAIAADRPASLSNLRGLSIDRFNYVQRGGALQRPRGRPADHPLAMALV